MALNKNQLANNFATDIEHLRSTKHLEYTEAIIEWCETNSLDIEYAATLIKKDATLLSRIEAEAREFNVIKKTAELPI